jgi:phosphopantetheinyl transferase (holo-ACP synthase)
MNIFLSINDVIFGNDIVDLKDSDTSLEHLNLRFINKICTEQEKKLFYPLNDKNQIKNLYILWKIWSLKESTYKSISRIYYIPNFRYKDFIVHKNFQYTIYKDYLLNNFIYCNKDFIFTLTYYPSKMNLSHSPIEDYYFVSWIKKLKIECIKQESHSLQLRKYINNTFKEIFKTKTKIYRKFDLRQKIYMPPYIYFKKQFYPISLSHHGRYLVFTIPVKKKYIDFIKNVYKNKSTKTYPKHFIILESD